MAQVYIGLGSNLDDREGNINCAVIKMKQRGINVLKLSSVIATKPYGVLDQPEFLNAVCLIETQLQPLSLLSELKNIELQMGREKSIRWGPRLIDLDILLYDDLVFADQCLQIPHADMLNRPFVLAPLFELAPDLAHPVSKKRLGEHLGELEKEDLTGDD